MKFRILNNRQVTQSRIVIDIVVTVQTTKNTSMAGNGSTAGVTQP